MYNSTAEYKQFKEILVSFEIIYQSKYLPVCLSIYHLFPRQDLHD